MLKLARYLKDFKLQVIIGPFFKLLEAIFELIIPLVMASIIDVGINNKDTSYVYRMTGFMILLGALGLCFALICQYSAARASQGCGTNIRNDIFAHINTLSYAELDKIGTNSLITRITNDVNQVQLAVAMLIRLVVRAPFLIIGATVMSMMLDIQLSLIFLFVAPVVSFVLYWIMKKSIPFYQIRQSKLDSVSLITRENLEGVRVIRSFSKQEAEKSRFQSAGDEVANIAIHVGNLSAFLNPATFTILNLAILAIIWFGGLRVDEGALTQGQIVAFVNYMTQISLALVVAANLVVIFTKASASAARINEIFDTHPSLMQGAEEKVILPPAHVPKITFQNVYFTYNDTSDYALEDISFSIDSGETVGIIGGTGSGKSTLVNLIPRFYDVSKGEILIDGIPVQNYSFSALRNQFGVVPQKAVLFEGTVLDNIRWGKEDATLEEIKLAIAVAQATEFVESKSDQYEARIEQGGKNLSGGQKQRLTIARALVGSPEILILDDSASALDFRTDSNLRKAIREYSSQMTVFIVSQRATSIQHADKIIVLEDGQLVGLGTHKELFDHCEVYHEICLSQLTEEEARRS